MPKLRVTIEAEYETSDNPYIPDGATPDEMAIADEELFRDKPDLLYALLLDCDVAINVVAITKKEGSEKHGD